MKLHPKLAMAAGLGVIALTGTGLSRLQSLQHLGPPGVRVIPQTVRQEDGTVLGTNSVTLPEKILDYESKEQPIAKVVADWLPKDTTYAQRVYQAPDRFWIQANVVLMGTDRTSIHKPEYCLAGQGFRTERVEQRLIRIADPPAYDLPVQRMTLSREAQSPDGTRIRQGALYVFWFVADHQLTADHSERMWWMARDLITRGVLQRWAYVSCFAVCPPGREEEAYARVCDWIASAAPHFQLTKGPAAAGSRTSHPAGD